MMFCAALPAQISDSKGFATNAKFSFDDDDATRYRYTCAVAISDRDLNAFLQHYHFDGKTLRLKTNGSYVCDMNSAGLGTPKFGWDVDLTIPVL